MRENYTYHGNALDVLKTFTDDSVDCCITSPPYWGLRDYGEEGQLGLENDFNEYIDKLINIYDEIYRVIKPTGSCFVNLGDTYGTQSGGMAGGFIEPKYGHSSSRKVKQPNINLHKSLCMIPERFAIRMIENGWTLRNQIIWHKPNQMPSSAKDRFTVDFEKVFFFVKQPMGYYFEQQLEPYTEPINRWGGNKVNRLNGADEYAMKQRVRDYRPVEEGKNMRTVWSINTEPFADAHFATYPSKLVERMLRSACPENGIVLDPFMGAGTTAVVARKLNRKYIGIEINSEYIDICNKRLYNELGMFQ